MQPREHSDRIEIAFDERRLVANAGRTLPIILAHHLGLGDLVDRNVDLGDTPGRANAGDKLLTLVASALAGGDCIDDADALRAGGTEQALGRVVKAPSTLGTFLRFAGIGGDDCPIERCGGFAVAVGESDGSDSIPASYAVMFSSERQPDYAVRSYDEDLTRNLISGANEAMIAAHA